MTRDRRNAVGQLGVDAASPLAFGLAQGDDGSAIVTLRGDLDMRAAEELEVRLRPVIERKPERLVLDLRDLRFADSSGIALFIRWANLVPRLELREPAPLLRRVVERMGLAERLRITP